MSFPINMERLTPFYAENYKYDSTAYRGSGKITNK